MITMDQVGEIAGAPVDGPDGDGTGVL